MKEAEKEREREHRRKRTEPEICNAQCVTLNCIFQIRQIYHRGGTTTGKKQWNSVTWSEIKGNGKELEDRAKENQESRCMRVNWHDSEGGAYRGKEIGARKGGSPRREGGSPEEREEVLQGGREGGSLEST